MGYIEKSLGESEKIVYRAHFHWIYTFGALLALIFLGIFLIGIGIFLYMMIVKATTEIAVTNERFVYKTGWIARSTKEVTLRNIEEVNLTQTVLGRILGYGKVVVRGTGAGIIELPSIDEPLKLRRSILSGREAQIQEETQVRSDRF